MMMGSSSESCTTNKKTPAAAAAKCPSLLGSLLTTDIISNITPFLDFRTLLSLREMNTSLRNYVSKQELLSRSVADLRHLGLNKIAFGIGATARAGWSEHNIDRNALVQEAVCLANDLGQDKDSRHIIYEEGKALNLLTAGRPVSMADFQRRDVDDGEDNDEDAMYFGRWRVTAPEFHKSTNVGTAWRAFKKHLQPLPIEWRYDENNPQPLPEKDTSAFARVLFGLLINARLIQHGTFQIDWAQYSMHDFFKRGESVFGVLLIETTDERKFEIQMDSFTYCCGD